MSDAYPGSELSLPEEGRGSLASWTMRLAALIVDWAASMIIAVAAFGTGVLTEHGWRAWMILAVFFVQAAILTVVTGGSFGQLLAGVGVVRTDREPLDVGRAIARTALKCLVVPVVVIGANRRHLADLLLGTVVVRRRK